MQQSLSLAWTAKRIARLTILAEMGDVPSERLPALDLPIVLLRYSTAHVIAAVPLKPRGEPAIVASLTFSDEARRVLTVEDEPLIAMNLEDMLTELGHHVTAIATRIDKALQLAEGPDFNLAFLDINISGSNTFQVADILRKRAIRFIFTSGYGVAGLIDGYRGEYMLIKPFSVRQLEHTIAQVLSTEVS